MKRSVLIGFVSGLALFAAIAASAAGTAGRQCRRLGRARAGDLSRASRVRWCARRCGFGTRIPRRSSTSSGSRRRARSPASPKTARSRAKASSYGGCAARRVTTRRRSTASIPARCATAGRTDRAGWRCARARCSKATGRTDCSTARASMSTPTATATKALSRPVCRRAKAVISPAPARFSRAASPPG